MNRRTALLAGASGLVLADTSIVTLALPDLQRELHTTVDGVAAVLVVYTAVLAIGLWLSSTQTTRLTPTWVGFGGFGVAAIGSAVCGLSGSLAVLLVGRVIQALGGAVALVAAFELVQGAGPGRRIWLRSGVLGVAAGPALGGALAAGFGWRAIFAFQVPVAAVAALVCLSETAEKVDPEPQPEQPWRVPFGGALALALTAASLSAVLFLLVLLMVAGWDVSPLRAAVALTVLPLSALVGYRIRGDPWKRACAGSALIGCGVMSLAWTPQAHLYWTLVPELFAGIGLGLVFPALAGEVLPERNARDAARSLSIRHAGVAVLLIVLAPLIAHELTAAVHTVRLRGVGLILDSPISPQRKFAVASSLAKADDRASLLHAIATERTHLTGDDQHNFDVLGAQADEVLLDAIRSALLWPFLISGALAWIAALVLAGHRAAGEARSPSWLTTATGTAVVAVSIGAVATYAVLQRSLRPAPVVMQNPCHSLELPLTTNLADLLQGGALDLLDATACRLHTSREELVLALADRQEGAQFARTHAGFDPNSIVRLLGGL